MKEALAVAKIHDNDNVYAIRQYCELPYIGVIIECRHLQFVNVVLDIPHLLCLLSCMCL